MILTVSCLASSDISRGMGNTAFSTPTRMSSIVVERVVSA